MRKTLTKLLWYILWLFLSIITLFPIYWTLLVSLRTRLEIFTRTDLIPNTFYLENYFRPLFRDIYGRFLLNSVIVATGNTLVVIFLAVLATFALSRFRLRGSSNIFFWTLTNRMAPPAAFTLPLYLLFAKILPFFYDTHFALILVYCVFNLPFAIWLLKGTIDSIPRDIDEAAYVDGATLWQVIWKIIFPMARPGIMATAVLTWLFSWNEYLFASTLTNFRARTMPTGLAEFVTVTGTNWGEMAAMTIITMIPAFVFLFLVQKYIVVGMTFGAVKE
ncbi:binding-protein-dependent transport systems inner membrane component [Thermotoga petrophila RKU-10]|uniref:Binding-protein-dependent transport systems inner membrane component n=1 Tax=Thermotoga petrophila (strain ATCC BAA-489 / DSM 13996 / JCM 10882 / RKU-10) TaxID=590168 RepID=D2C7U3_THEP2|nr:carbohydrate ABC transporter permease [Thermotoga petrophila]ADA67029.1 binding-protein-dependent transport systems inner membrane component [Thermotoga petrophila RKU-10]